MELRRNLMPHREILLVFALLLGAMGAVLVSANAVFPALHSILDTGVFLLSALLAFLLWDMGWRSAQVLPRLKAMCFSVVALLELLHVITALDFSEAPRFSLLLKVGTWSPAAYLLPAGLLLAASRSARGAGVSLFALGLLVMAAGLMALFTLPRYSEPIVLGITRPTLVLAPVLWVLTFFAYWRIRGIDRLARAFAVFAAITLFVPLIMLYSQGPADKMAVLAHFVRIAGELYLLFSLTQMGTADTARRMLVERQLTASNEVLEARVAERTAELQSANADLRAEAQTRQRAERRALLQLERLDLLQRITHAIAERQDLESIYQVVARSVEEHMPVDFAMLCNYEHHTRMLTVSRVGTRSGALAMELEMPAQAQIEIDGDGLSRCVDGDLVYEPDITAVRFPFPQRLARAGLKSMVIAPLMVEQRSGVFGVFVVARRVERAFSSGECEFLRQLCDHVSLAANQAQLHASLQKAYEDLQRSQNAVMQQERLRALGQMASGIAHDINNAISPITLYVDALLTHESGFSDRARKQLEIIQRAVEDVAHTVARMGEFYRQRQAPVALAPVAVKLAFQQVLELTRARWSDMAQQRGAVIETRVESDGAPTVVAIESELREALINLVFNATDAMPEGGVLTLRTGHALEAAKGISRRVFVEVSDTGSGMDEATRRRCLEPFFTTKGERGSGLGLAMVYGIAQRHGADLEVISTPGEGTTVRLTFPPAAATVHSTGSVRLQKIPRHTRILLIDDDPVLLTSLRETLVHDGHEVQTALGGRAGIEVFLDALNAGKPFPVVITDLGMPHVDGRAVSTAIKTSAPATFVIMLTGWGQRLAASGEMPEGVVAVLGKPPKLPELRQCLAECTGIAET